MSSAFFLMVLHMYVYSIRRFSQLAPISIINYSRFVIRAQMIIVGDNILDFCGLGIALATRDALDHVFHGFAHSVGVVKFL